MVEFNSTSIFVVLKVHTGPLANYNTSWNDDTSIGIFHIMFIQPEAKELILRKPYDSFEDTDMVEGILVPIKKYQEDCTELLTFRLYNN